METSEAVFLEVIMTKIQEILFRHQDEKYRVFMAKLVPTLPIENMIGIRSPEFKKIIKEVHNEAEDEIPAFLEALPHQFLEENYLQNALLSEIKDFDAFIGAFEKYLPCVNNWAVSDGINPPVLQKNHEKLVPYIKKWILSDEPYTKRIAMHFIMKYFFDEDFNTEYLDWAADIRSEEYYVNMMTAWLFAEALVKQWDAAIPYIQQEKLDVWTHNKAIQKACESFRISPEQKEYLKSLKRKQAKK